MACSGKFGQATNRGPLKCDCWFVTKGNSAYREFVRPAVVTEGALEVQKRKCNAAWHTRIGCLQCGLLLYA
jgi:hypothetical protein